MNAKDVIDTIKKDTGVSSYAFAKYVGVPTSTITRIEQGETEPNFEKINSWLEKFGYQYKLEKVENNNAPKLDDLVQVLTEDTYDENIWIKVYVAYKNILEYYSNNPYQLNTNNDGESIPNSEWKAFYAAFVEYLTKKITKTKTPEWTSKSDYLSPEPWCPLPFLSKAHTPFDTTFKKKNVLLPKGELQWI
ncbi:MAG: helix-turn-helix domain-containing protein [Candidatus Ancillula sp.]|nr:helix-turn-helix domain-containing protein [Candidatus Ancillula sp.]